MGFIERAARALGFKLGAAAAYGTPWPSSSDALYQATLEDLYGLARGIHISRERAMKLAPVSKSRRVIAGTIGRMTLQNVKGNRPAPTQMSLLAQPERGRTLSNTLTWLVDQLIFYPHAWWIVTERDAYGWPTFVKMPDQCDVQLDTDGKVATVWGKQVGTAGAPAEADIIQFDSIDSGALHDAVETLQRAIAINRAVALAEDNPVPSVDLHYDGGETMTDPEIDALIERWVTARKSHGVGWSSKGLTVNALGIHPEQLLIEGRKAINLEIVRHLGIPAWAADVTLEGSSLHYENRASRNWELIDLALAPYMTAIADRLSLGDVTPRGWRVKFLTDELTQPDQKTRFETYKLGTDAGFVTNEWVAEQEGWDTPAPAKAPTKGDSK